MTCPVGLGTGVVFPRGGGGASWENEQKGQAGVGLQASANFESLSFQPSCGA